MLWSDEPQPSGRPPDPQLSEDVREAGHSACRMAPTDSMGAVRTRAQLAINLLHPQLTMSRNPSTHAVTTRRSSQDGRMPDTVRRERWESHRQPRRSPKLRDVARALRVSESVAETRLYGERAVNLQAAAIIRVLMARGEVEAAAAFEAPISAAMMGPIEEPLLDLQRSADEAEGYSQVSQAAWVAERSDTALGLYIRKRASELYYGSRLLAALKAEQARRAGR